MAWRHAATVEVAIETAVRAQDGHPAQSLSSGRGHELGRRARNSAPRWSTTSLAVPGHAQEWSEPRSRPSYGHMMSTGRPHVAQREVSLPEAGSVRSRVGGPPRRSTCRDKGKRARNGGGPGSGAPAPRARDGRRPPAPPHILCFFFYFFFLAFFREGNRAPVSKATQARYRGGTPLTRA